MGSSIVALGLPLRAIAQSTPPPGVTVPPGAPDRIEQVVPKPSESPLPQPAETPAPQPSPSLQTPESPSPGETIPPTGTEFLVNKIDVQGSTVLKSQIANLVKEYEGKELTFEKLVELRSRITQLYFDNGYVTSGAFIPNNQDLRSGTVQIQVIEGTLEAIDISGLNRLRRGYVASRIAIATQPPLNRRRLEEALQLLQLDPLIAQINAELAAGTTPGRNVLRVQIREARAFHAGVLVDNNQPPSIGSLQGRVFVNHDNLLGFGDRIVAEYGHTEGLDLYDINYSVPVSPRNATVSIRYGKNDSDIVEDIFRDLGIRSETETFSLGFRQPLVRTPRTEFALGLSLDLRRSQSFILDDIPFSFSDGPEEGEAKVSVLRFSQDWVNRGARRVLAARSQFSFGIDAFGATVNDTGTDGRFFSWLGQFQWVQQISPRVLLISRVDAQLTPDSLLPLERFSLGGVDTVRGYRQNQLVADNGIAGSLEVRIPLTYDPNILQITPFVEIGAGWNQRGVNPDPDLIAGVGFGLRWRLSPSLDVRLDYGIPLVDANNQGDSLQDNGLYFSVRYQPL